MVITNHFSGLIKDTYGGRSIIFKHHFYTKINKSKINKSKINKNKKIIYKKYQSKINKNKTTNQN